jgi:hypothetical protein
VPREVVDDGRALVSGLRSLYSGNDNGVPVASDILVKILSEDGERLLYRRLFTVTWGGKTRQAGMDPRGIEIVADVYDYIIEPVGEWWCANDAKPIEAEPVSARVPEYFVPGEATMEHTGGRTGAWNILVNGEVWTSIKRNQDETKEQHRARAKAIAAGSEPRPVTP